MGENQQQCEIVNACKHMGKWWFNVHDGVRGGFITLGDARYKILLMHVCSILYTVTYTSLCVISSNYVIHQLNQYIFNE